MQCPYCAERVADDAIHCKSCNRGLEFFIPVNRRVAALETRIAELQGTITNLETRVAGVSGEGTARQSFWNRPGRVALYVLWAVALAGGFNLLYWVTSDPVDSLASSIAEGALLIVGFWMGVRVRGRHIGSYIVFGALVAPLTALAIELGDSNYGLSLGVALDGDTVLLGAMQCAVGGMLGDLLERFLASRGSITRLIPFSRPHTTTDVHDVRGHVTVGQWLTALAPIIGLAGTVATAYYSRPPESAVEEKRRETVSIGGHQLRPDELQSLLTAIEAKRPIP